MAITRYGVFKGTAVDFRREDNDPTPHFQLFVEANNTRYRVPVNVKSSLAPSQLVYVVDDHLQHPITAQLPELPTGYTRLPEAQAQGLDYIRGNLFDLEHVRSLPHNHPGQDNDLQDILASKTRMAINAGNEAQVFVFGEPFPSSSSVPAAIEGMHDIHMNQGNHANFRDDDGVFRDGGLIFHFPHLDRFIGFFLAFQSQHLHTDDQTGHAIPGSRTFADVVRGTPPIVTDPVRRDGLVRIVAALINPEGAENQPGHTGRPESVILLNTTPQPMALDGWSLVDRADNRHMLNGIIIPPGEAYHIPFDGSSVLLGNAGGTISLLDDNALKIDGVSYTKDDAKSGWTKVF